MNAHTPRSGSNCWWWPSTATKAVAAGAAAAVLAVPLTGAAATSKPVGPTGSAPEAQGTADPAGFDRQCFMIRPRRDTAPDGAVPRCPAPGYVGPGERSAPARCPSLPDPRYVGVPWAADVGECPRVSRWWRFVTVDEAEPSQVLRVGRDSMP